MLKNIRKRLWKPSRPRRTWRRKNGNQYLTTEHLLYALLDQDGGLIGLLFGKMGVDCDGLLSELDTLIRKLPRISGGSGEVYAQCPRSARS